MQFINVDVRTLTIERPTTAHRGQWAIRIPISLTYQHFNA